MKLSTLAAAAAVSLLCAGVAAAQGGQGNTAMQAVRQACAADVQKLCPDKTGPDRRQCMADHQADVSDGCKQAIAAMRQQMQMPPEQKPQR